MATIAVDRAWRRVGLATALVEMLAQAATDRGIHTFSAYYLAQNRPVAALLRLADDARQPEIKQGIAECAVALQPDTVAGAAREADPAARPRVPPPADRVGKPAPGGGLPTPNAAECGAQQ